MSDVKYRPVIGNDSVFPDFDVVSNDGTFSISAWVRFKDDGKWYLRKIIGTGARGSDIVTKVGKVYFECHDNRKINYMIESLKFRHKEYSQNNIQLYKTKEEILDINEASKLDLLIRKFFQKYGRSNAC